ncbi:MAG: LysE family transporter [Mycobacteriales bacterium]
MTAAPAGALVAGVLAGYGVAVPVGAIAPLLISLTARTSLRVGAAAALGVATADGAYALVAVAGGTAATRAVTPIATPLRWVAAAVLVALAVRTAAGALRRRRAGPATAGTGALASPPRAYLGLLGLTLLNPATIVYFAALVLGRQAAGGGGALTGAAFVAGTFAASASWQLLLAGSGSVLGRLLTGSRGRLATALAGSAVVLLLAASLLR